MKMKWISKLFNATAILLIIASVFVLLSVLLTPAGQVPRVLGYSVFRVLTGSMEPEIPQGSLLLVKQVPPEEIEVGDVISFFSPDPVLDGCVNTHRVQRIEKRNGKLVFITKGDANAIEDQYPPEADLLVGRVVFQSGGLGKVVRFLSNPLVFGSIILFPLLAILLLNLYRAVHLALDIAKKEEEEAVRQALEAVKAKQNADSSES